MMQTHDAPVKVPWVRGAVCDHLASVGSHGRGQKGECLANLPVVRLADGPALTTLLLMLLSCSCVRPNLAITATQIDYGLLNCCLSCLEVLGVSVDPMDLGATELWSQASRPADPSSVCHLFEFGAGSPTQMTQSAATGKRYGG